MNKTSNFKKILSAVLVLMMVMTTFVFVPMTASAADVWDGSTKDTSWYDPAKGNSWEDAYIIADAADLMGLAQLSAATTNPLHTFDGKYFVMTADIDLNGAAVDPLFYANTGFGRNTGFDAEAGEDQWTGAIHWDGGNHTVSNVKYDRYDYQGFFSILGRGSEIKNLHFSNVTVDPSRNSAIEFAGVLAGAVCMEGTTISNVSADTQCQVISAGFGGGLIGDATDSLVDDANNGTASAKIEYCVSGASVTGANARGGFIARYIAAQDIDFNYCVRNGLTTDTSTSSNSPTGGFIGHTSNNSACAGAQQHMRLNNCYNVGKIQGNTSNFAFTSGFVADFQYGNGSSLQLTACYDYGVYNTPNTSAFVMTVGTGQSSDAASRATEVSVSLKDCYAAPHADNVGPTSITQGRIYDVPGFLNDYSVTAQYPLAVYSNRFAKTTNKAANPNVNSYMVKDLNAAITLGDSSESTIAAEMAKIDEAIAEKAINDVQIDISTVGARMGLTDPYGFMLITDIQYAVGGQTAALADVTEYGFYFLEAAPEQTFTAAQIVANAKSVKAEGEAYNGSTTEFASTYAEVTAAELDTTVYFVAYATITKGGISKTYYSQVRDASPVVFVEDFKDGYMYGAAGAEGAVAIANAKEVAVYDAMYEYHVAYKAYLDSVTKPQA